MLDLFILHSNAAADASFVRDELVPALGLASDRVMLSSELPLGKWLIAALEETIATSRVVVAVTSPEFLANAWVGVGESLANHLAVRGGVLVPLLLVDCVLPPRLDLRVRLDCRDPARRPGEFKRLRELLEAPAPERDGADPWNRSASVDAWVLVAGSGSDSLPVGLASTARLLGTTLAKAGLKLITGGWPGVDAVVARAFAETLQSSGRSLSARLLQIQDRRNLPAFSGGQWVPADSDDDAWRQSVERADAVVLLGGVGGTLKTGHLARDLGRPVLPIADTRDQGHDDAYRMYFEIVRDWDARPVGGLTLEQFRTLGEPAPRVVERVVELLTEVRAALIKT